MSSKKTHIEDPALALREIAETVTFLRDKLGESPEVAIILGSGLGSLGDRLENAVSLAYGEIPGFMAATAPGHSGRLIVGTLADRRVVAMQGRFHYYEGHEMAQVVYPIRVFASWGVPRLIVTNACGGINLTFQAGDLMLIRDVISLFCPSPLRGANLEALGPRFFDMTKPFSEELQQAARMTAAVNGIALREGVYAYAQGPHFETPSDIRLLRILGADAVGMSTVPEIIAARHAGMRILGISCITNMAAGVTNATLNHEEVLETGRQVEEKFCTLITGIVGRVNE